MAVSILKPGRRERRALRLLLQLLQTFVAAVISGIDAVRVVRDLLGVGSAAQRRVDHRRAHERVDRARLELGRLVRRRVGFATQRAAQIVRNRRIVRIFR